MKLRPKQIEVMQKLQKGWEVWHGVLSSRASSRSMSFNFDLMICPPGRRSGDRVNVADLERRGLVQALEVSEKARIGGVYKAYQITDAGRALAL